MDSLRLDAVDADDLAILSACCQDAVLRLEDCLYLPGEQRFVVAMNRFAWEKALPRPRFGFGRRRRRRRQEDERRRSVLHFNRVGGVRRTGLEAAMPAQVLSLLTLRFTEGDAPSGTIELVFAGGSAIRLDVECVEARLSDQGAAWSAAARPDHDRPGG